MQAKTCQRKGIHLDTRSGLTFSIQWGPFNYCGNKDKGLPTELPDPKAPADSCADCEVAVMPSDGMFGWISRSDESDQVWGWIPIEKALKLALELEGLEPGAPASQVAPIVHRWLEQA